MAAQWKTKASQRTQMGKGNEAYKALVGVKSLVLIPPEVVCPVAGVEQFANDHFQTGDFTGYTQTKFIIDNGTCLSGWTGLPVPVYMGSYDASEIGSGEARSLQQLLTTPVPVSCIGSSSTFSITTIDTAAICDPANQTARILYTDGTYTDVTLNPGGTESYVTYDLKPFLDGTKTIKGILFTATAGTPPCTVHVGQVTLTV